MQTGHRNSAPAQSFQRPLSSASVERARHFSADANHQRRPERYVAWAPRPEDDGRRVRELRRARTALYIATGTLIVIALASAAFLISEFASPLRSTEPSVSQTSPDNDAIDRSRTSQFSGHIGSRQGRVVCAARCRRDTATHRTATGLEERNADRDRRARMERIRPAIQSSEYQEGRQQERRSPCRYCARGCAGEYPSSRQTRGADRAADTGSAAFAARFVRSRSANRADQFRDRAVSIPRQDLPEPKKPSRATPTHSGTAASSFIFRKVSTSKSPA